jgi:hypothetical protein
MRRLLARLMNAFHPERAETDLEREIGAHLALLEDEYRRRGRSEDEARLAARRALGSTAHAGDLHRDARSFMWLDDLRRDLSHAARSLRRNPGFACVAVLTLALGIGANTAIFSVISAVLLKPLPYPGADRLVQIFGPIPDYLPAGTKYPRQGRAVFPDALRAPAFGNAHARSRLGVHPGLSNAHRTGRRRSIEWPADDGVHVHAAGCAAGSRAHVRCA